MFAEVYLKIWMKAKKEGFEPQPIVCDMCTLALRLSQAANHPKSLVCLLVGGVLISALKVKF